MAPFSSYHRAPPLTEGVPEKDFRRDPLPYESPHDHLCDELRWLNHMVTAYVAHMRSVNFYDDAKTLKSLFISDEEIDDLLMAGVCAPIHDVPDRRHADHIATHRDLAQALRHTIDNRLKDSVTKNIFLPLRHLETTFRLNAFDIQALVICLAPLVDARYERIYAYLQNDINRKWPTGDLIVGMLVERVEQRIPYIVRLDHASPLLHHRLLELIDGDFHSPAGGSSLRVDQRIAQYVLGIEDVDHHVRSIISIVPPLHWDHIVIPQALRNRIQDLLTYELSTHGDACIYLHGPNGVGKKSIARAACGTLGCSLVVVDIRSLSKIPHEFWQLMRRIMREGLLRSSVVCFDHVESLRVDGDQAHSVMTSLIGVIQEMGWLTFLCSEEPLPSMMLEMPQIYPLEVSPPQLDGQLLLWQLHLDNTRVARDPIDLRHIAHRFNLTGRQICDAVLRAEKTVHVRDPQDSRLTTHDLIVSSRVESQPKLNTLGRKIEPKYCWEDLVLPEGHMSQLHEIAEQVKHRHTVMGEWGFANKLSLGLGLTALFAGPSGTGKTMAAEVIGYELDLDMYKIDLSAVVSKYIGETEKNLNRLFNEAEHSNVILFFDEADALFGKRSEVKDAHDRYANIEVGFLLQKMEEYEGITILSSNLRRNIDEAFVRRIQFIIDFPFPDATHREMIWRKTFPDKAPLGSDVDFTFLATRFKLTGGHIRNIGLRSSYYAAQANDRITMAHVVRATKRELQKIGKLYTEAEFGDYGEAHD